MALRPAFRVLVVDDDVASAVALRTLLELDGYEAVAVDSPQLALGLLGARRFDVVVTDLEMPEISGLELVRRARTACPPVDVFVVSGCAEPSARAEALALGARAVLGKPLDYEALVHALALLAPVRTARLPQPVPRPTKHPFRKEPDHLKQQHSSSERRQAHRRSA